MNKKKTYLRPTINVIKTPNDTVVLAGSSETGTTSKKRTVNTVQDVEQYNEMGNGNQLSKYHNSLFDDEEEDDDDWEI